MINRVRNISIGWKGLILPVLVSLFSSCETDIDINTNNQDVAIVYCILDIADSVQYVKLNKTYLLDQAALLNPPKRDSQFFEGNIDIVLERWEGNKAIDFTPFYPTTEIPKDTGFFPVENNVIYKADTKILPDTKYHLNVYLEGKEKILHAETTTVGKLQVTDPLSLTQRKISLNTGVNYTTRWEPVDHAGIYQVVLRFNYNEVIKGNIVNRSILWPQSFTSPVSNVDYLTKDISGSRFFYVLADKIPVVKSGLRREVTGVDIMILSGGLELKYYIESTAPSSGALMERPIFSNITNGLGVFSSMATKKVTGLFLASTTIDSIAYGKLTKELLFLDHRGERDDGGGQ